MKTEFTGTNEGCTPVVLSTTFILDGISTGVGVLVSSGEVTDNELEHEYKYDGTLDRTKMSDAFLQSVANVIVTHVAAFDDNVVTENNIIFKDDASQMFADMAMIALSIIKPK